jgi:hypothetical protein
MRKRMVQNNFCDTCAHAHLCIFKKFVDKFSDDNKHPLGIDIDMKRCSSYEDDK